METTETKADTSKAPRVPHKIGGAGNAIDGIAMDHSWENQIYPQH